jgi:hypothetical protein
MVYNNYFGNSFKPLDLGKWVDEILCQINFEILVSFNSNPNFNIVSGEDGWLRLKAQAT